MVFIGKLAPFMLVLAPLCVHWCLPGPIDVWNEMLFQMLLPD